MNGVLSDSRPSSPADAFQALLEAAAEAGARKALEQVQAKGAASRWIPIKESPLGYRATLDLVKAGELQVHGIGHRRYLDREQLDRWLLAHPIRSNDAPSDDDEIAELIAAGDARREKRSAKRKPAPQ